MMLTACRQSIEEDLHPVSRCASCPVSLTSAASFTCNGKLYVFGGRDASDHPTNRLYAYHPETDSWSDEGSTPLKARVRPRAVEIGGEVYIGLGFNGHVQVDTAYLKDWWHWTPASNTWSSLDTLPSDRTVGPVTDTDGKYIYAVFGGKKNFERWIFRYDISSDSWDKLADGLPRMASYPPRAHSAAGNFCQGRFFLGAGYTRDGSDDFWCEAELKGDSVIWHGRCGIPGKRHNAVSVSDGQYIYLIGGHYYGGTLTNGGLYDEVLRYDPQADRWTRIARLPDGGRENLCAWVHLGVLYVGLGNDENNKACSQLYQIQL